MPVRSIQSKRSGRQQNFSAVFSDFYLFDRLYGRVKTQSAELEQELVDFEIQNKVRMDGERFVQLRLSNGERKRLALACAKLERKKILLLDEWAQDQDPLFREKFYRTVLPSLKSLGWTVIAISHDDRYFSVADRIITLDWGHVVGPKNGLGGKRG